MPPRRVLRLLGVSLLAAFCLAHAALAQGRADAQTQALVRRLRDGDKRERLAAAEEIKGLRAKAGGERRVGA